MATAVVEGSLTVAALQILVTFIGVYILDLGGTAQQLGVLTSLPFLFNAVALILSSRSSPSPRKALKRAVRAGVVHRMLMALIPLAPLAGRHAPWWVIVTYSFASAAMMLTASYWMSAVSDMFPARKRGRVFGVRGMFTGFSGFVATLVAGTLLDALAFPINFSVTFWFATALAVGGTVYLAHLEPPGESGETEEPVPLKSLLRGETGRAFLGVTFPVGLFNVGFFLLAPIVNIYFVETLSLSNSVIGLLTACMILSQMVGSLVWGGLSDRWGNYAVAFISTLGMALQAACFWISPSVIYLACIQILGGFSFGGVLLSTFNAVIAIGDRRERSQVITWFHVFGNLAGFVAPLIGTAVMSYFGLAPVFMVAALFRGASSALFLTSMRRELMGTAHRKRLSARRRLRRRLGL